MKRTNLFVACASLIVLTLTGLPAQTAKTTKNMTKAEKINNAMSAAPASIAKNATIIDHETGGKTGAVLREGTNGWTCMPDFPNTPTNDPFCADKIAMGWLQAWMNHTALPKRGSIGVSYMLLGGSSASNSDAAATKPAPGEKWIMEPPHLMLFGMEIDRSVYSTDMKSGQPWIMFSGTPMEHLMVPVK